MVCTLRKASSAINGFILPMSPGSQKKKALLLEKLSCTTVAQTMWSSSFPTDADFGFAGVPGPTGGHRVREDVVGLALCIATRPGDGGEEDDDRGAGLERKTTSASSSHSRTSTSVSPAPTICASSVICICTHLLLLLDRRSPFPIRFIMTTLSAVKYNVFLFILK